LKRDRLKAHPGSGFFARRPLCQARIVVGVFYIVYRPLPSATKAKKNLTAALTSGKNYPENIASEKFYPF
jgi:hypothetical protein